MYTKKVEYSFFTDSQEGLLFHQQECLMLTSPFNAPQPKMIDEAADIIFVADMFVEDYAGGAEMTTEALISSATDLNVYLGTCLVLSLI